MSKIVDPDLLTQSTEVVFDTSGKTIQLLVAGNLSTDGVTLQALYSFCKEEWKTDSTLIKYPFPLTAITEQKFDLINGWDFKDATTKNLIRDAGWALKDTSNVSLEEYMGVISLGSIGGTDQVYYQQEAEGTATNVVLTGAVNQAVKIYGDATHGDFDYRSYFKIFVREQGKAYDQSQLSAIGQTTVTYQVYSFPLGNSTDLKITHDDTAIDGTAPYTGMSITYYSTDQSRSIGGSSYDFDIIIDGNGGTKEQIYEFVQRQLRKDTDIDADITGEVIGKTADTLLRFVGDTLITSTGVFIDDFAVADTNNIEFYDVTATKRTFPYVATGQILFNDNLVNDANAIYRMFFTSGFGTAGALLVQDDTETNIAGTVSGLSSISFTFDYDGNIQGGRTAGTDANVTVVAVGLNTAQYVVATGTIGKSKANIISLVSPLERNYSNPV